MKHIYDVIIIGGGPGGYTAALYATRSGLDTVVLEKLSAGGQMALSAQIDNYPGFPEGVDGFQLGESMRIGAEKFGAQTQYAEVYGLDLRQEPKKVTTSEGDFYGKAVIIATGANPRELGVAGEKELTGKGVNYCAACDGMFYRGKTVVVVGGGNTAAAEALHLSKLCQKVILVHRRDTLRATQIYHAPLQNAPNVEFRWNSAVTELIQEGRLTGVKIRDVHTKEETVIPCDGIFISIGRTPNTQLVQGQVHTDKDGYILSDESTRTNIPGVFAVGDVRTKLLRQIVTAVADGAVAAHHAVEYVML